MTLRIALFGTSADPPTAGHQVILHWLAQHYDQVAVWAADNPFKGHQTPLEHRSAMLQLMIEQLHWQHHGCSNLQLRQDLSSPRTIETLAKAKQIWENAELTLVIGSDLLTQLPKWHHVDELLSQVQLLVVPRAGYPITDVHLLELKNLGAKLAIAHLSPPAVSSTDYRQYQNSQTIPPTVEDYIHREGLYVRI